MQFRLENEADVHGNVSFLKKKKKKRDSVFYPAQKYKQLTTQSVNMYYYLLKSLSMQKQASSVTFILTQPQLGASDYYRYCDRIHVLSSHCVFQQIFIITMYFLCANTGFCSICIFFFKCYFPIN